MAKVRNDDHARVRLRAWGLARVGVVALHYDGLTWGRVDAVSSSCRRSMPMCEWPGSAALRCAMRAQASVNALALLKTAAVLSDSVLKSRSMSAWSRVTASSRRAAALSAAGREGVGGSQDENGARGTWDVGCNEGGTATRDGNEALFFFFSFFKEHPQHVLSQASSTKTGSRRPGEGGAARAAAALAAERSGVVGQAGGARSCALLPPGLTGGAGAPTRRPRLCCRLAMRSSTLARWRRAQAASSAAACAVFSASCACAPHCRRTAVSTRLSYA